MRIRKAPWVRGAITLAVAAVTISALAITPGDAASTLTKAKAKKLFYTKKSADARFINVGEKASDSDKVDGIHVVSATVSVTLPSFSGGQQQCKSTDVTVPGVQPGNAVMATPATEPTWFGSDQTSVTVDSVPAANTVTLIACTSADSAPPFTPTATNYRFVAFS
jgi:hypothetical protein